MSRRTGQASSSRAKATTTDADVGTERDKGRKKASGKGNLGSSTPVRISAKEAYVKEMKARGWTMLQGPPDVIWIHEDVVFECKMCRENDIAVTWWKSLPTPYRGKKNEYLADACYLCCEAKRPCPLSGRRRQERLRYTEGRGWERFRKDEDEAEDTVDASTRRLLSTMTYDQLCDRMHRLTNELMLIQRHLVDLGPGGQRSVSGESRGLSRLTEDNIAFTVNGGDKDKEGRGGLDGDRTVLEAVDHDMGG